MKNKHMTHIMIKGEYVQITNMNEKDYLEYVLSIIGPRYKTEILDVKL